MDKQLLIRDLQKGMKIKMRHIILTVDYVYVKPTYVIGTSYAVGIGERGNVYLITDKDKLVLHQEEKETTSNRLPVICSECGRQMVIKEWMQANAYTMWRKYDDEFMVPRSNMEHLCRCGRSWTLMCDLIYIGNVLIWKDHGLG